MKYYITITIMLKRLITTILLSFTATSAQAFTVTIEQPTAQSSPITNDVFIVDFNNQTLGNNGFSLSNGNISYTYSNELAIIESNVYGNDTGAGFESDNHTFSVAEQTISGTLVIDVPPAIVPAD